MNKEHNKLVVFQSKNIRRTLYNDEWWFVIKDVVFALTDSKDPSQYLKRLRSRDTALNDAFKGGVQNVPTLGLEFDTSGGRQMIQCWNTKGIFRLIQSIPSKKAEPFKQWLAKVGYERIQEIENPELAQDRAKEYYELKGYPKDWIDKRLRGVAVRQALTEEWSKRDVEDKREYAILTNEIARATFGVDIKDHKLIKGLDPKFKNQNLRDHMTDLELIFTMLGEASTTEIARKHDAKGFEKNKLAAGKGGKIAGDARKRLELETGDKVISEKNYLNLKKKRKKLK